MRFFQCKATPGVVGRYIRACFLLLALRFDIFAAQSIVLNNASASVWLPNGGPYLSLVSPGSYWIDIRVTAWSLPSSGCNNILQLPGGARPVQMRICASGGIRPFSIDTGSDVTRDYAMVDAGPPRIAIAGVTTTNPMTLTLASAPYPLTMAPGKTITIFGSSCSGMNGNQKILSVSDNTLTIAYNGSGCSSYTANSGSAYSQDFLLRYHRDRVLGAVIAEAWNVDGTGYALRELPVTSAVSLTLPGAWPVTLGSGNVSFAYLRWFAGTIAVNGMPPWGNAAHGGETVLADWEFEGNGDDGSGKQLNLKFGSGAIYQSTPVYAPACDAGPSQSWRAGAEATLASRSFPLDGGDQLSYIWRQIPSDEPGTPQQRVLWKRRGTASPSVYGFTAGPLNFQLTVTDGGGVSSTCSVHNGAVATDDAGNVALADEKVAGILGPLLHWGSPNDPWPFFDTAARMWSDLFGSLQGNLAPGKEVGSYIDAWNAPSQGTVSISYGELRAYGTGTSFRSTFCNGGTFVDNAGSYQLVFWYPNPAIPGGFGRRSKPVGKCVSDTVVDLQVAWSDDDGSSTRAYRLDAPATFSYTTGQTLTWRPTTSCAGGPTSVNVNGLGAVPLKRADGVSDPTPSDCARLSSHTQGITLSYGKGVMLVQGIANFDWHAWKSLPGTTSGMQYAVWGGTNWYSWAGNSTNINFYDNVTAFYALYYRSGIDTYLKYARWLADKWWSMPYHDSGYSETTLGPRNAAVTGLYLRAIDQDNIAGAPGSSAMWTGLKAETDRFNRYDIYRDSTNNQIVGDIRESGYSYGVVALCAAYHPDQEYASTCRVDVNTAITNIERRHRQADGTWHGIYGSAIAVPNNWIGATAAGTVTVTPGSPVVTLAGGTWSASLFPAHFFTVGNPWDPATRDAGYYSAAYVDATHIKLDRPYSDVCAPTCSGRLWIAGPTWVGFGTQPFMLGILGQFFHQAFIALNKEPQYATAATLAKSYLADVTNWLTTTGVQQSRRGMWYGVGVGVCAGPNPPDPSCSTPDTPQTRSLNGEVLGTLAIGYMDDPNPALKARIDNLFSAVYAKFPNDPGYDGIYLSSMDQRGFNYTSANPKWQGFFFGMGRNAAWPSARLGGLRPPEETTVYVNTGQSHRSDAARFQVLVTDPTGAARAPVTCSAMPCAVQVDRRLGNAVGRIAELSADGKVLAIGRAFVLPVK